jgi:hypothetical protein
MATIINSASLKIPSNAAVTLTLPDGGLKPAAWSDTSGDEFPADKAQLFTKAITNFDLAIAATPVAREEVVFVASSAGTINKFAALLNDTGTSTNVGFVLKKNGSTLMASALDITHATSDRVVVAGSLTSSTFVAGDVFSIQLTVSASTGAQGPFAWAEFIEVLS